MASADPAAAPTLLCVSKKSKEVENLCYKEILKECSLFSLENRTLGEDIITVF